MIYIFIRMRVSDMYHVICLFKHACYWSLLFQGAYIYFPVSYLTSLCFYLRFFFSLMFTKYYFFQICHTGIHKEVIWHRMLQDIRYQIEHVHTIGVQVCRLIGHIPLRLTITTGFMPLLLQLLQVSFSIK